MVIVVLSAAFLYTCALPGDLPASVDTSDGLPGTYSVNGVDPSGSEFSGTAVIRPTDGNSVFDIELLITGSIQQGRGELSGNRFQGTWRAVSSAAGQVTGTFDYLRSIDGTLTGTWTVDGSAGDARTGDQAATGTIELFPDP
jgi:hypothetical protein